MSPHAGFTCYEGRRNKVRSNRQWVSLEVLPTPHDGLNLTFMSHQNQNPELRKSDEQVLPKLHLQALRIAS